MRRRQLSVTSVVALLLAVCGSRSTAHVTSPILLFAVFYEEQVFVDHANLGRSATDVVVVRVDGSESHRYVLYEKRDGRWSAVYRGGGFGC